MMLLPAITQTRGTLDNLLNKIHHADALELLRRLPDASIDLIVTDPPYGLNKSVFVIDRSMRGKDHRRGNYTAIRELWDSEAPIEWMQECKRVLCKTGSVICFGGRESIYKFATEALRLKWRIVNDITLVKPDPPPNFTGRMMTESTERALWFSPHGSNWIYNLDIAKVQNGNNLRDVWNFRPPHDNRVHPAQKPLDTIEFMICLFSNREAVILDPFCGSGTTAIAARKTGRQFICGDLSAEYVEVARKRLQNTDPFQATILPDGTKQLSLFENIS
jgi:site-specific DNA-methyltransferase (adenine-specific)